MMMVLAAGLALGFSPDGTPYLHMPEEALRAPANVETLADEFGFLDAPLLCSLREDLCYNPFELKQQAVGLKAVDAAAASTERAQADLGERLDAGTRIPQLHWQFNKRMFFVSTAFDRADKMFFGFFTGKAGEEVLEPEDGRLLKSTIPVDIDKETKYVIRLQINIWNPNKSKIIFAPAKGFPGKTHEKPADELMGLFQAAGQAVPFSKGTLYFYYSTDADAQTKKLAATRSYRFVKPDGRNTKAYTVREEALEVGKWVQADLGGQPALLQRTESGRLLIHEPN